MRTRMLSLAIAAGLTCLPVGLVAQVTDRDHASRFVVLIGTDTMAVEDFVWGDGKLESELRLLTANVRFRLTVGFGDDLVPLSFDADMWQPADDPEAAPRITSSMEFVDDSVFAEVIGAPTPEFQRIASQRSAVPFINLSFALVEHAVRMRRLAGGSGEVPFFLWANGQTLSARLAFGEDDSATLTLGDVVLELTADASGRVLGGAVPSQNLTVVRVH